MIQTLFKNKRLQNKKSASENISIKNKTEKLLDLVKGIVKEIYSVKNLIVLTIISG